MKDLTDSFSSLEKKVDRLLSRCAEQAEKIHDLEGQLSKKGEQVNDLELSLGRLKDENKVLKMASAVQGSDENRTEAKRRINELVREIDRCISMMSK